MKVIRPQYILLETTLLLKIRHLIPLLYPFGLTGNVPEHLIG